jgi:hypothetical protein
MRNGIYDGKTKKRSELDKFKIYFEDLPGSGELSKFF